VPPDTPAAPLARRSVEALVGEAAGARLPAYVTREQARAVIAAAGSTRDRLLFECLWQTGGRVTEVLRLRRGDVDAREGALRLANLKQRRRALREKLVYVSPELLRDLVHYAKDLRLGPGDHFFTSRKTDAPGASGAPSPSPAAHRRRRKSSGPQISASPLRGYRFLYPRRFPDRALPLIRPIKAPSEAKYADAPPLGAQVLRERRPFFVAPG
jgi:integrase